MQNPRTVKIENFDQSPASDVLRIEWGLTEADNGRKFVSAWVYDDTDQQIASMTGVPTTYTIDQGEQGHYPLLAKGDGSLVWDDFRMHEGGMQSIETDSPSPLANAIEDKRTRIEEIRDLYPDGYIAPEDKVDKSAQLYIDELEDKLNDNEYDFAAHERVQHRRAVDQLIDGEQVTLAATSERVQRLVDKISELLTSLSLLLAIEGFGSVLGKVGAVGRLGMFLGRNLGRVGRYMLKGLNAAGDATAVRKIRGVVDDAVTAIDEAAETFKEIRKPKDLIGHLVTWGRSTDSILSAIGDLFTGNNDESEEQILERKTPEELEGLMGKVDGVAGWFQKVLWDIYYFQFIDKDFEVDPDVDLGLEFKEIDYKQIPREYTRATVNVVNPPVEIPWETIITEFNDSGLIEDLNTVVDVAEDTTEDIGDGINDAIGSNIYPIDPTVNEFADTLKSRAEDPSEVVPHQDSTTRQLGADTAIALIKMQTRLQSLLLGYQKFQRIKLSIASLLLLGLMALVGVIAIVATEGLGVPPAVATFFTISAYILTAMTILEAVTFVLGVTGIATVLYQIRKIHGVFLEWIEADMVWDMPNPDWTDNLNGVYDI
ncbi:hypothetical protein HARCEL1_11455 [Halococcoides cellulosivorans]|uniref:Uncharacterized protein n=2 Tax=Halococcoides cellulosivorans TaxID=1679096 RepID=A0A2R4X3A0_9EURY|nr:hypothetical protein HARCEL1_11455 [Halococcoides cellulosivorans]